MFIVPSFVPPTLEQLTQEIDEVTVLVKREAQLNRELDDVQKHNKDAVPLGVVRVAAEVEDEVEEDLAEGSEEEEDEAERTLSGESTEELSDQGGDAADWESN
ncbi:hypothetical protein N2152v2_005553 [Parachlorella kessleri]